METCPPVLLLGYQRPHLARQVLAHIRDAAPTRLYLAVDGVGDRTDRKAWEEMRALAKEVDWPGEVRCRFLEEHTGSREAVGGALDWFFQHEEEGIVLEDDCLPDPGFFVFCRDALARYRDEPRVMMVCGCNLLAEWLPDRTVRFATDGSPWGWASWRRAWQTHRRDHSCPILDWGDPGLREWLDPLGIALWEERQRACERGWVDSWDFPWQLDIIRQRGLCLLPGVNLIRNLGCGPGSTHTTVHDNLAHSAPCGPLLEPVDFPALLQPDPLLDEWLRRYALGRRPQPATTAADVARRIRDCEQPAKQLRKLAKQANREARRGAAGQREWRHCFAGGGRAREVETRELLRQFARGADLAAARLEAAVAMNSRMCKGESGGQYLHAHLAYGQEGEDRILAELLAGMEHGFYVDVGAHHPFRYSNTWLLYQRGWSGINIDPAPGAMREFDLWRPRDINLAMAAGAEAGELSFYHFAEAAYSTLNAAAAAARHRRGEGGEMMELRVQVLPLREILARHLPPGACVDLLNLDVEGCELDVLAGIDWETMRPRVILCEALDVDDLACALDSPVARVLAEHGYRAVAATTRTLILARR